MDIISLHRQGISIREIARRTGHARKTIRKYLESKAVPRYKARTAKPSILDPYKDYLQRRMAQGVFNCSKLLGEIREKGYPGSLTIIKDYVRPFRQAQRQRATVRFETGPGQQAQVDWAHFGKIWHEGGWRKLYALMVTLGYSRTIYVEFTVSQDLEHFLQGQIHAFEYFGGVPEQMLVDNLKSAVLWRDGPRVVWNPRYLDFASHYGFVPRACWPYRAQTKGKVENTVGYVRGNFWVGIEYLDLADLNAQARRWCDTVANQRTHQTTREVPAQRLEREQARLGSLETLARYDTSYLSTRKVSRDCLVSYQGVKYSVPHQAVGKVVRVRQPLAGGLLQIYDQDECIATHTQSQQKGTMVIHPAHYAGLPGQPRLRQAKPEESSLLPAGPGVGLARVAPLVEVRSLAAYEVEA
jgi:transposase